MGYPQPGYMGDVPVRRDPRRQPDALGSWLSKAVKGVTGTAKRIAKQVEINVAHAPSVAKPLAQYAAPIVGAALAPVTGGASLVVAGAVSKAATVLNTAKTVAKVAKELTPAQQRALDKPAVLTAPVQTPSPVSADLTADASGVPTPTPVTNTLFANPALLVAAGGLAVLALSSMNRTGRR